jgi:hypothetical protein
MPEFIVESIDKSDNTWKFFNNIQDLKEIQTLGQFPQKFTSLATNATIFRWRFGDQPGDPIIETTVNPYIHIYNNAGTYSVSHQSCYPCVSTGTLTCSNGWCTKSIKVKQVEHGNDSLVALAGLAGLFVIIKGEDCCGIRKICEEKRAICKTIKPEDIENTKECKAVDKICITRLKDCQEKCIKAGHTWQPLPYRCVEKHGLHKELCQTIEQKKDIKNKTNKKS